MEIDKDELEEIIQNAMAKSLASERTNFRVPSRQHFLDHEQMAACRANIPMWHANHEFVTEWRTNTEAVKRSAIKGAIWLIGLGIVAVCVWVTAKIKGWL